MLLLKAQKLIASNLVLGLEWYAEWVDYSAYMNEDGNDTAFLDTTLVGLGNVQGELSAMLYPSLDYLYGLKDTYTWLDYVGIYRALKESPIPCSTSYLALLRSLVYTEEYSRDMLKLMKKKNYKATFAEDFHQYHTKPILQGDSNVMSQNRTAPIQPMNVVNAPAQNVSPVIPTVVPRIPVKRRVRAIRLLRNVRVFIIDGIRYIRAIWYDMKQSWQKLTRGSLIRFIYNKIKWSIKGKIHSLKDRLATARRPKTQELQQHKLRITGYLPMKSPSLSQNFAHKVESIDSLDAESYNDVLRCACLHCDKEMSVGCLGCDIMGELEFASRGLGVLRPMLSEKATETHTVVENADKCSFRTMTNKELFESVFN